MKSETTIDLTSEFRALREQIVYHLRERTLLMTFNITVTGVLLGQGLSGHTDVLLVVPIITSLFGLYLVASMARSYEIGDYIRTRLESKLNTKAEFEVLGWESWFERSTDIFWDHFLTKHFPIIGATAIPSVASIVLWFSMQPCTCFLSRWEWILIVTGSLLTLLMIEEYLRRMIKHNRKLAP